MPYKLARALLEEQDAQDQETNDELLLDEEDMMVTALEEAVGLYEAEDSDINSDCDPELDALMPFNQDHLNGMSDEDIKNLDPDNTEAENAEHGSLVEQLLAEGDDSEVEGTDEPLEEAEETEVELEDGEEVITEEDDEEDTEVDSEVLEESYGHRSLVEELLADDEVLEDESDSEDNLTGENQDDYESEEEDEV